MKMYGPTIAEGSEITNITIPTGTSFPANESTGELFFRTDQNILYVYDGTQWIISNINAAPDLSSGSLSNPLLQLPFKNSTSILSGVGSITHTRSTTATYIDRDGTVQTAAIDNSRFEKQGFLHEGESTNKLTYSEQLDNAAWTKVRSSISANAVNAPDGTTTADKLVEDSTSAATHYTHHSITHAAGALSGSCFLKAAERSRVAIGLYNATDGYFAISTLDLSTGNTSGDVGTVVVTELANGWWRLQVSGTATVTSSLLYIFLDNGTSTAYNGDGSSGAYIWGAQVEELKFSSSYIPTTTAAATRTADNLYVTYSGNFPLKGDEFTAIADVSVLGDSEGYQSTFFIAGESFRGFYFVNNSFNAILAYHDTSLSYARAPTANTTYRSAITYDGTTFKVYEDGSLLVSAARGTPTGTATAIYIGSRPGGLTPLYGHISNFKIYDTAFSESTMRIA